MAERLDSARRAGWLGRRAGWPTALTIALAMLAGCSNTAPADTSSDDGYFGAVLEQQYAVPEATLTATDGEPYDLRADTSTPLTLVFFGYTHCPDICQAVMGSLASALTRLDEEQRSQVQVLFITTDPARDDAQTLRAYLDRFDPTFEGLTGDLDDIAAVGEPLHVWIKKGRKLPTGGYDVEHGTQVLAVDDRDAVPIVWTEGTSSAQFADDLGRLLEDPLGAR